jgi:tetratricopeptide (TPR) repeat protein
VRPLRSFELAFTRELLGEDARAAALYREIAAVRPRHTSALLNLAALHHKGLVLDDAVAAYSDALATLVSYRRGCFRRAQSSEELFARVRSPVDDSRDSAEGCTCPTADDLDLAVKILSNQGLAFRQRGSYVEAIQCFQEVLTLLRSCETGPESAPTTKVLTASVDLFLSAKAGCFFSAWDWIGPLLSQIDALHLKEGVMVS